IDNYREVVRIAPASVDARLNLALLYERVGRRGMAARELRALLEISPGHAEARRALGRLTSGSRGGK
ncbi:MAG TPA: tetratricopeptide repeat protein, partial [Gammaproteobacteria bacterium]|nr:tetratricopeptide repeat protein [Gammaproteobacteria bacterium]